MQPTVNKEGLQAQLAQISNQLVQTELQLTGVQAQKEQLTKQYEQVNAVLVGFQMAEQAAEQEAQTPKE